MLEPYDKRADAMILEFKVHNATKERSMADTVRQALAQIEKKKYNHHQPFNGWWWLYLH